MATTVATLVSQTFTDQQGNYQSEVLSAGAYTELIFDFQLSSISTTGTISLNRINPLGQSVEIWAAGLDTNVTWPFNTDIGPCDGYAVSHAFGDQVQIVLTTEGTYSGTLCLQAKGLA